MALATQPFRAASCGQHSAPLLVAQVVGSAGRLPSARSKAAGSMKVVNLNDSDSENYEFKFIIHKMNCSLYV